MFLKKFAYFQNWSDLRSRYLRVCFVTGLVQVTLPLTTNPILVTHRMMTYTMNVRELQPLNFMLVCWLLTILKVANVRFTNHNKHLAVRWQFSSNMTLRIKHWSDSDKNVSTKIFENFSVLVTKFYYVYKNSAKSVRSCRSSTVRKLSMPRRYCPNIVPHSTIFGGIFGIHCYYV